MEPPGEETPFRRHVREIEMYVLRLERRLKELEDESDSLNKKLASLNINITNVISNLDEFDRKNHVDFLLTADDDRESNIYAQTEHLRMQGAFWTYGGIDMLDAWSEAVKKESRKSTLDWILTCWDTKRGGFGGNTRHAANLLYTQHAVYVLFQLDALDLLDKPHSLDDEEFGLTMKSRVISYVKSTQLENGSFRGDDEWEEIDTRFTYCAAITLALLNSLHVIDSNKAIDFILSTRNELDGGFGCSLGVESHSGYVFTALAALSVLGGLDRVKNWDSLAWWLAERQCDSGGLNGRPEKLADVCYTFWTLSSLWILNRLNWIDKNKLFQFVNDCLDPEVGGFADHPGNCADVYHTFFALAGLGMLDYFGEEEDSKVEENTPRIKKSWSFNRIHPVYALPLRLVKEAKLPCQVVRDEVVVNL